MVTLASLLVGDAPPWVEHDGQRFALRPVDVIDNGMTRRPSPSPPPTTTVPFDPAGALLDRAAGRPEVGVLAPGAPGDLVVWATDDHRAIPYHYGANLVRQVVVAGARVSLGAA